MTLTKIDFISVFSGNTINGFSLLSKPILILVFGLWLVLESAGAEARYWCKIARVASRFNTRVKLNVLRRSYH